MELRDSQICETPIVLNQSYFVLEISRGSNRMAQNFLCIDEVRGKGLS
jgi:hypothetical protein